MRERRFLAPPKADGHLVRRRSIRGGNYIDDLTLDRRRAVREPYFEGYDRYQVRHYIDLCSKPVCWKLRSLARRAGSRR